MSSPPERVRVSNPRAVASRPGQRTVAAEIDAQSGVGEVYVRSLVRSQLRLALGVVLLLVVTIGALPLLFALAPAVRRAELLGVPVAWWVLGGGVYPFLVAVGWAYVRRAERNERRFSELLDRR